MNTRKQTMLVAILVLTLMAFTGGLSYAFFSYFGQGTTENVINTGTLIFVYDEQEKEGNGINLVNALPMTDEVGKALTGNNNIFEFQVRGSTKGASIDYEVYATATSTGAGAGWANGEMIKLYLVTYDQADTETAVQNVTTYNDLTNSTLSGVTGKTLYTGNIANNLTDDTTSFRLRMWISDAAITSGSNENWAYNAHEFSVKVNVQAVSQ